MFAKFITLVSALIAILFLLAVGFWVSRFPTYMDCLDNNDIDNSDCFKRYLMNFPPVQEANEIQEACRKGDSQCLLKIGEKAVTDKMSKKAKRTKGTG